MLKFVNTDIVFQEVPDETTIAINISGCPCHCPGCHSSYLWQDMGQELTADILDTIIEEEGNGAITCVSFMGGDGDPATVNTLAMHVHNKYKNLKTCWYTGKTILAPEVEPHNFDYIKIGPYIKHLGPLKSATTNQRMYKQLPSGEFEDITPRFWKK